MSACGSGGDGESTASFKTAYGQLDARYTQLGTRLASEFRIAAHQTNTQFLISVRGIDIQLKTLNMQLVRLQPPGSVRSAYTAVQSQFGRVAADLDALIVAGNRGSVSGVRAQARQLVLDGAAAKPIVNQVRSGVGLPPNP